jgi:serine/threonine protein kinase
MNCPNCEREIPAEAKSCPSCATSLSDSFSPTQLLDSNRPDRTNKQNRADNDSSRKSSRSYSSFDSIDNARFVPGEMLAERYRIVGLLGRGGMGEVYRADDLKLGQPVALKFLPDHLLSDGAALARFHREVRVARQVSHKNVCRVYDIGEIDGRHFLSMEFIKGEELSSLLRRIGRLPQDKAIQLARQICAGLAAAHDVGFLHRDLKPANVMIDGEGNARILDFGLAGLTEEFRDDELAAGTPAYMAPEQLEGKEQTVKTDIYSLGLVLYELFTGKRAFEASTLGELIKLRRSDPTPTTPTSIVKAAS